MGVNNIGISVIINVKLCRTESYTPFLFLHLMSLKDHTGIESSCDMTEMRIFTMARQVASALVGSKILSSVLLFLRVHVCVTHNSNTLTMRAFRVFFLFLSPGVPTRAAVHSWERGSS